VVRLADAAALDPIAYRGAALVFLASPDAVFLAEAAKAAKAAGAPVNVVDHPELSDFHTPAIIDRGQVVAAIGTAGAAPMLAALLRADLEARMPEGMGAMVALLGDQRVALRASFPDLAATPGVPARCARRTGGGGGDAGRDGRRGQAAGG